jgi:integrase
MRRRAGTGTIEATRDGRFRARYPLNGERADVGIFATAREAAAALDALVSELYAAGHAPRAGVTLGALGDRCLALRRREGYRSIASEENRWKVHLAPWELARAPASSITRADVRAWLAGLARKGLAAQTRRNALNLLRAVLEHGVELEILDSNPARDVRVKDRGTVRERSTWLSLAESERLIRAAASPAVTLSIVTGLRHGELRSLEWADVHEDHLLVRFGAPGKPPKNGKIRRVPLLPVARATLATMRRHGRLVFPGLDPDASIWRLAARADWLRWLAAAGISRRVRWHDLRHTCATLLLSGAWGHAWSTEAVRELLGHSSVKVTERYARALGSLSASAADTMQAAADATANEARTKPATVAACAAQVLRIVRVPPAGIGPATFGLGNPDDPSDPATLPPIAGFVRALQAVAAEDPTALRQCVEAIAEALRRAAAARAPTPAAVTGRRRPIARRRA